MDLTHILAMIGLAGVVACIASYVYGYIWRPVGFRPLHALGLFATIVALGQLSYGLTQGVVGLNNVRYALAFLVVAAVAQAFSALKSRADRDPEA